jgi:hypothetical protein
MPGPPTRAAGEGSLTGEPLLLPPRCLSPTFSWLSSCLCSMATELRAAELRLGDAETELARRAEEAQVGGCPAREGHGPACSSPDRQGACMLHAPPQV